MITSLATYDRRKAAFRTWLYRIVANHVLVAEAYQEGRGFLFLVTGDEYHGYIGSIADEKADASPRTRP